MVFSLFAFEAGSDQFVRHVMRSIFHFSMIWFYCLSDILSSYLKSYLNKCYECLTIFRSPPPPPETVALLAVGGDD